jgi:hypothetical protein
MKPIFPTLLLLICLLATGAPAQTQPVTVAIAGEDTGPDLAPRFLGLSYESSMVSPDQGRYYFDAQNQALLNVFRTLGVKSLRIGGNAVDDGRAPVPQEKDIDQLFQFARAAGVKVIYSFRLKDGNPADSARLARHIATHGADLLDAFAIGNEPDLYKPKLKYPEYFALWKPHYDAILQAVPRAMFDGPSTDGNLPGNFATGLAGDLFPAGHMAMISDHHYFLGSGRVGETNPPATRARFLSNQIHAKYDRTYTGLMSSLAAQKIPYRMDELNSCSSGGAKNASDTYASTLWALDCTHWWAAHHIMGMNYHTGEFVGRDGAFGAPNYTSFLRLPDGSGFELRPQAYALLAFTQGAHGHSLATKIESPRSFDFSAYAFRDQDGSVYVTLINKSYGDHAQTAAVSLPLPAGVPANTREELNLAQADQDVAAKSGVTLGGAAIDPQGIWAGKWTRITSGGEPVQVAPASAKILRFRTTTATANPSAAPLNQ